RHTRLQGDWSSDVCSSDLQEEALDVSDRVVVMNEGKVEQVGTPSEIVDHPANAFVNEFVGDANVLEGVVSEGEAVVGKLRVPARSEERRVGKGWRSRGARA